MPTAVIHTHKHTLKHKTFIQTKKIWLSVCKRNGDCQCAQLSVSISRKRMLRLFGPGQLVFTVSEPSMIGDLAVDTPINYGRNYHYCGPFTHAPHINLALFVLLFTVCAIEVIFVKVITAIREGMTDGGVRLRITQLLQSVDRNNNDTNNVIRSRSSASVSVHREAWNWVQALHQTIQQSPRQSSLNYISMNTFLDRITQATMANVDDNNNY